MQVLKKQRMSTVVDISVLRVKVCMVCPCTSNHYKAIDLIWQNKNICPMKIKHEFIKRIYTDILSHSMPVLVYKIPDITRLHKSRSSRDELEFDLSNFV